jgi:hypothetical protein
VAMLAGLVRGAGERDAKAEGPDGGQRTGSEEAAVSRGGVPGSIVAAALAAVEGCSAAHAAEARRNGWRRVRGSWEGLVLGDGCEEEEEGRRKGRRDAGTGVWILDLKSGAAYRRDQTFKKPPVISRVILITVQSTNRKHIETLSRLDFSLTENLDRISRLCRDDKGEGEPENIENSFKNYHNNITTNLDFLNFITRVTIEKAPLP